MNSVSAGSRSRVASAKSVPSTLETKRKVSSRCAVVAQRLVGHHRAEVGAADADVDDVADRLAGVAGPLAASGRGRRRRAIRSSTSCTSATTSSPSTISERSRGARSATCSTARSSVTLMRSPREHRVDPLAQPALLGQRDQQPQRLVGDPVLRVVEVQAGGLGGQPLAALGVVGEQLAQVARRRSRAWWRLERACQAGALAAVRSRTPVRRAARARTRSSPSRSCPGLDERRGALLLELRGQRVDVDAGLGEGLRAPPRRRRRRRAAARRPRRGRRRPAASSRASC